MDPYNHAIDMTEMKRKLSSLEQFMPNEDPIVCSFAAEWAKRMNYKLDPEGAYYSASLLLFEMKRGVTGYPDFPLPSSLIGQPSYCLLILRSMLDRIIRAVSPKSFADAFDAVEVNEKARSTYLPSLPSS